jgi:hypothetical protein
MMAFKELMDEWMSKTLIDLPIVVFILEKLNFR